MPGEPGFPKDANASPTKRFFVDMLVRDIELKDTLLDLLDNCVDGILRTHKTKRGAARPYDGYRADIVVSPSCFQIEDNCGGIPIAIAQNSAFAIGRPVPIEGHDAAATVGMYGIGMKRAIFKLGTDATVDSWNDRGFRVRISPSWLADEDWKRLPMKALPEGALEKGRTRVRVDKLHPSIKTEFEDGNFVSDLIESIAENYALIIEKGFAITVRRSMSEKMPDPIDAKRFALLRTKQKKKSKDQAEGIAPYVYVGKIGSVEVEIYAGLYRHLPDADEQELEEETRGSKDDAGWTVICNDRAVVWKDRTRLTGWGESTVPNYHGQFIAITGIVLLRSENPKLLPLTTTKRGLDAGSELYSKVKDMMREATKGLTSFTNKWKKFEDDLEKLYLDTSYVELSELRASATTVAARSYHKIKTMKRFAPKLPVPARSVTSSRVSFLALKTDVARLSIAYFGEPDAKPREVGEEAFKRELEQYQEAAE